MSGLLHIVSFASLTILTISFASLTISYDLLPYFLYYFLFCTHYLGKVLCSAWNILGIMRLMFSSLQLS